MGFRKKINQFGRRIQHRNVVRTRGGYDEKVWLIGAGRSGTTWVSSLISSGSNYRQIFEPFHPVHIPEMRGRLFHLYLRPGEPDQALGEFADRVFSGDYFHRWTDRENKGFGYRSLLVKDVFCNLSAAWMMNRFPDLKVILLVRNPFAVALSKQRLSGWNWMNDPTGFFQQQSLVEDYLEPFRSLLDDVSNDYIEQQVFIWSVLHYVPLKQLAADRLHVVFYEDVVQKPVEQLAKMTRELNLNEGVDIVPEADDLQKLSRVSRVTSTMNKGVSPVFSWQDELSAQQMKRGMKILSRFGLDGLYGGKSLPCPDALRAIQKQVT